MKRKILFVASECQPFAASGGLGDVIGSLPKALAKKRGNDVRVILPLYGLISEKYKSQMEYLGNLSVPLCWRNQYCGIFTLKQDGVTFYFIDNEYYFRRSGLYGYLDEAERYAFFSHAALDILPVIDFIPQIIHCHDWQTALVPVYLKTVYKDKDTYENIRTVFTIHNMEYQGRYSLDLTNELFGIPDKYTSILEYEGDLNLMKGAIQCADTVTTVSPTYANEIHGEDASKGLYHIIRENTYKVIGILNGIDEASFDPATDPSLYENFDATTFEKKKVNKLELLKELDLPQSDRPVIAIISRLVEHKGVDIVKGALEELMQRDLTLVVLGTGDYAYEEFFKTMQGYHPSKMKAIIQYNGLLARKLYASADMFLMPSKNEPCGLAQMMASEYGTVPIVRKTGGLADSITDAGDGKGMGYTFIEYTSAELVRTVDRALEAYDDKAKWEKIAKRAMKKNFSWDKSATVYLNAYKFLLEN
ncbi:MAG: glycogen synthase GlgA [Bacillota bacterium]